MGVIRGRTDFDLVNRQNYSSWLIDLGFLFGFVDCHLRKDSTFFRIEFVVYNKMTTLMKNTFMISVAKFVGEKPSLGRD